ncbi:membrane protein EpsK [Mycoplana sp. BE70]|uniref:lipopolysaccharide biosynthesis protein n=1 Tax=Mycoplana sp. BE70 TaxID=2817775 RepID=UPI0028675B9D|nr:lipopolysaccharide biosynthesis protein [Mycoplana sp. BE70]MDR6756395.1 membrane protein EpsK [Mycoplana sp. BE70]
MLNAGITGKSMTDVAKVRFVSNVASNAGYVVMNTALMLWYVPFLVSHLGVAAYGMIALANSLVMYGALVGTSLNVSINRFLAIDLNQDDSASANRTFNTALVLSIVACSALLVPVVILTYFLPALFNVPAGLEPATQFLFASVCAAFIVTILSSNFGVASVIRHRFDLRNIVNALMMLTRVGIIALCFMVWPATLWQVAAAFIVSAMIGLAGDVVVWRRLTPELHLDYRSIDSHRFRALANLGGWSAVNQTGALLLMQVDLLIVNAMFGAEMTGRYGAVLLFPAMIHTLTEAVAAVLSPAIMARYAVDDIEGMRRIACHSVKLLGVALALPVGLLCGFAGPLLHLWLGPEFAQLDVLLILLVGHLAVNLAIRPLLYVVTAYNKVKVQGLLTLALGFANIGLAIVLARWSGWGVAGIAAAAAIVWTVKNCLFLSSYCAVLLRLPWWSFYAPLTAGALGTLAIGCAGRVISQLWWPADWLTLGAMAAAVAVVYSIGAYTLSLSRSDRDLLWSVLDRRSHA